mmetsp:Transcript_61676/g.138961  ORF Transcript_61676/g.138961 Transcript_61676/m.138961 type:complete len:220 (-) Transcript_61676:60-719(-)
MLVRRLCCHRSSSSSRPKGSARVKQKREPGFSLAGRKGIPDVEWLSSRLCRDPPWLLTWHMVFTPGTPGVRVHVQARQSGSVWHFLQQSAVLAFMTVYRSVAPKRVFSSMAPHLPSMVSSCSCSSAAGGPARGTWVSCAGSRPKPADTGQATQTTTAVSSSTAGAATLVSPPPWSRCLNKASGQAGPWSAWAWVADVLDIEGSKAGAQGALSTSVATVW